MRSLATRWRASASLPHPSKRMELLQGILRIEIDLVNALGILLFLRAF
jgi:hypothetical protein